MPVLKKKLSEAEFNQIVRDPRLSMKERGMLATLQAMSIGEEFSIEEMAKEVPDGYSSLLSMVRSLQMAGFVERRHVHGEDGHRNHTEYSLWADDWMSRHGE